MSTSLLDYPAKLLASIDLAPVLANLPLLVYERYTLLAILFYVAVYFYGSRANTKAATEWFNVHQEVLKKEFAGVGMSASELFIPDTPDEFHSYCTGRRGVENVSIVLRTSPKHDLVKLGYQFARGVADLNHDNGTEKVMLDFTLKEPSGTPAAKFCFAIVNRSYLRATLDSRWDLRTFTNTVELGGLPKTLITLTEHGDITDSLLKQHYSGLLESLLDTEGLEFLESLIITDGPAEKPDDSNPVLPTHSYHLLLTLRLPPSPSLYAQTTRFIPLCGNLIDVLYSRQKLIGELTCFKLRKRRTEVNAQLMTPILVEKLEKEKQAAETNKAKKEAKEAKKLEEKLKKMTKSQRVEFLGKEETRKKKEELVKLVKKIK